MPVSSSTKSRTGSVFYVTANTAPAGAIEASGQAVSRAACGRLWAYAQASGNLAASEGVKQKGQYGPGDGSTTFTVPNLQGEFVRALDKAGTVDVGRTIGSKQAATRLANASVSDGAGGAVTPRIKNGEDVRGDDEYGCWAPGQTNAFNAGSTAVRPTNVALLACIEL